MRVVLIVLYPLFIATRAMQWLLGRDPLRLRKPQGKSFWIAREVEPSQQDYFSESSSAEGRAHGGLGWLVGGCLRLVSRWYAPASQSTSESYSPAADREVGIPDEVYTLW